MRQALTRGLIVAAAATSALSLYGTGASAAPRVQGTVVKSAVVLPGHAKASDPDGLNQLDDKLGAMDEQLDGVDKRIDELELPGAAPEPAASGQGTASYGTDEPSGPSVDHSFDSKAPGPPCRAFSPSFGGIRYSTPSSVNRAPAIRLA